MKSKYITTTLPYVNASPHIGHAYEFIQADTLARYWRLMGHEVFFNAGTDEHGQKIAQKADEAGQSRQSYVDHYAGEFRNSLEALGLSPDAFIRTTDERHMRAAQELWKRCEANGDIYKKKYKGLYCVGCESFKKDSDLVEGKCPDHQKEPEQVEEENYFFRLSKYEVYLRAYLEEEDATLPDWRRKELLIFVNEGLEDISISRERARLDWGIPVPSDDAHVMYVWFDALTNYISTLGWPNDEDGLFKKFWMEGETLQVAGKDQMRFQSLLWQAMLKSANLPRTGKIIYHGFIISGGQKMSKTIGNVISPFELVEKYGTDATRYLLLRHVHPFEDTDITWERLDEWYTANLVNGLGNLASRIMKMSETYLDEPVELTQETVPDPDVSLKMDRYEFSIAMDGIWERIGHNDALIAIKQPFAMIKSDDVDTQNEAKLIIKKLVRELNAIATELNPFMSETAEKIKQAIRENKKPENLFPRLP
ncbi:MAG: class I tRNA ligase family protein [Candidatus Kaiserbacteria bacterium]|nr:class I tRNA ligase family protein [Candidatus Kaiserbacteria bacterium]